MWKYILKRLLWMIVVLLGVAFMIFTITYFSPGDPAEYLLGTSATEEQIQNMRRILGIDQPYLVQLGRFLYNSFIKFDLGVSWKYTTSVSAEIFNRLPRTLGMGLAAMVLTAVLGIPLGIFAATNQGKWQDYGVISLCMLFISLPEFWVALMMVIAFALKLGILPVYGIGSIKNYIMPVAAMLMSGLANIARQTRSSYLEVMRADFVTTARAKGQKESAIAIKHVLPNALMPVVTILGGRFALIVAGSAMIEKVFTIPGIGLYLLTGITYRDYPIIRGCALFFAVFAAVAMLLTDLIYAWIDPRIKAQYSNAGARKRGH
ncbi:MAG: ABC transporter permease [Lachnospiraceae bacterium]|nr:ABC transporter permease [Lachnospiraceae bacterium]